MLGRAGKEPAAEGTLGITIDKEDLPVGTGDERRHVPGYASLSCAALLDGKSN